MSHPKWTCAVTTLLGLCLGCTAGGCGGKVRQPGRVEADSGGSCRERVSDKPLQHACSHATNGPFETVVATPSLLDAPVVDRVHVSYLVEMVDHSPSVVMFTPSRNGEHLLLLDRGEEMRVHHGTQVQANAFAARLEGCETVQYGEVYTLRVGEHYAIEFPAGTPSPTLLFMEHLETFGDEAWTEGCEHDE